ncbi:hypothetical protein L6164_002374 [Bauhinia variegata]|uniref:Uncharacterized protein n=1 Tax=Bauhinia variegata TaxID=167791 RepID=A0ACB9PXU6_BAUVA|nr:hypothetical protein L6164_002374 [Bauhinia variegata]
MAGWVLLNISIMCFLLLLSGFPSYSASSKLLCNPDDSSALLQFKSSFTIYCTSDFVNCRPPSPTASWEIGTDCCSWDGVTCDTMSGHVIQLELGCGCLHGQIPPNSTLFHLTHLWRLRLDSNNISGELPSSISNLQQLIYLDVSWNNFSGQLPDVFGKLSKLTFLDLTMNNFEGQLPSSLFDLTQLSNLYCSSNKFTGPLPENITGFSKLTELTLADNLLNGTIPFWCLSLPSLGTLWLNNNQFTGHIGEISAPLLRALYLSGNKLQGSLPESIFDLENLSVLSLSSNNLSGQVNFHLFCKLNLYLLSLSKNRLSVNFEYSENYIFPRLARIGLSSTNITNFPKLLTQLERLEYLDLSDNRIQGEVPKWFYEIGKNSLTSLNLSKNLLTSMEQFPWNNLEHLDLSSNLLSGDISSSICNASKLEIVKLSRNKFTGIIPECLLNLSSLTVLDLQQNQLYGILPGSFSKQNNTLTSLNFNSNQLEGPLPRTLAHCTMLKLLDVGKNQIKDTFPYWLQTLPELRVLVLRANKFYGVITDAKSNNSFPKLRVFDVSDNNLSGPLPAAYIRNFKAITNAVQEESSLQYMNNVFIEDTAGVIYASYEDSIQVTIKGVDMVLEKIITSLAIIDLSNNRFQEKIPQIIGKLQQLKWLNLSHNKLTGAIPKSIQNLKNLESLDLSSNMLTGEIPAQLSNLNFLSVLNFSENHLVGKIPQGKQFNTFSNNSYEGNVGLCGPPLSRKCNNEPSGESPPSLISHNEEKIGFSWKPVAIGYGCGMVFGVILGYRVFSTGKPQWLVRIFGGELNRRARRTRTRSRANHGRMH